MTTTKADNTFLESSKIFDVSHVTAVVTGGGSGIGLMMTQVHKKARRHPLTLAWLTSP